MNSLFRVLFLLIVSSVGGRVYALPFNDDMVHDQFKTSGLMRPAPERSVPLRIENDPYQVDVESREEALELQNPVAADRYSIQSGERLWAINCAPCHGLYTDEGYQVGVVNKYLPGPDVSADFYKEKPDGHFYGYIRFGGIALMPRYGWKLSNKEHWDIVNYIRSVQN